MALSEYLFDSLGDYASMLEVSGSPISGSASTWFNSVVDETLEELELDTETDATDIRALHLCGKKNMWLKILTEASQFINSTNADGVTTSRKQLFDNAEKNYQRFVIEFSEHQSYEVNIDYLKW